MFYSKSSLIRKGCCACRKMGCAVSGTLFIYITSCSIIQQCSCSLPRYVHMRDIRGMKSNQSIAAEAITRDCLVSMVKPFSSTIIRPLLTNTLFSRSFNAGSATRKVCNPTFHARTWLASSWNAERAGELTGVSEKDACHPLHRLSRIDKGSS